MLTLCIFHPQSKACGLKRAFLTLHPLTPKALNMDLARDDEQIQIEVLDIFFMISGGHTNIILFLLKLLYKTS